MAIRRAAKTRKTTPRPQGRGRKAAPRRRRPWTRLVVWGGTLVIWAGIAAAAVAGWYALDLPDLDEALAATRRPTVAIAAADGTVIETVGDLYGVPVRLADVPTHLPRAVMAIEDRRFHDHGGVDLWGLARAAIANLRAGRIVQGGSTITQQVAKNLFLSPDRTVKRKVQELLLALWLERRFTKDQILTLYLNRVYFGAGAYGVEAAARRYFSRPARTMTLYQSALLAGLLKAPSRDNPINAPRRAAARTRVVLRAMVATGAVTAAQARAARDVSGNRRLAGPSSAPAPYFIDWVLAQVGDYVTPGHRDLVVVTSLDLDLQRAVERHVKEALDGPARARAVSEAAVVVLDTVGRVRAMVGGRRHQRGQFNRAVQARRQPGSAFKPFVWLAAVESGLAPGSPVVDRPVTVDGWTPRNFDGKHRGSMTLEDALARSVNTVAADLIRRIGPKRVVSLAHRLGIGGDLPAHPSLALGAAEVTLLDLTAAYAPLANGGRGVWPHAILEIRDAGGRALYRRSGTGSGQVLKPRHVGQANRMLRAVIVDGTGRAAALDRPVAGKTGTSQDFRDAWFIGYSADRVAGVWMGNDDGRPTRGVTGGGLPARLWRAVMADAHRTLPPRPLPGLEGSPTTDPQEGFWRDLLARFTGGDG